MVIEGIILGTFFSGIKLTLMFLLIYSLAGIKIKRGYKEKSKDNEPDEITNQNEEIHLIFVIKS